MPQVHCVQLFYNLSDPGMEDLLYEVESVRRFAGLRLTGSLPDETTILKFRHLLEDQGLGEALFGEINAHLASLGHRLKTGTIMDASIVDAPSSTKNKAGARDPQMRQAKKGNQWCFGMKAHTCLVLHGDETEVLGDAGYQGVASARRTGTRRWSGTWR